MSKLSEALEVLKNEFSEQYEGSNYDIFVKSLESSYYGVLESSGLMHRDDENEVFSINVSKEWMRKLSNEAAKDFLSKLINAEIEEKLKL